MGVDYEYELSNGWDKWQNVVLMGMKEIKDDLKEVHATQTAQGTDIALIQQSLATQKNYDRRIATLETEAATKGEIKSDRRWILGTAIAVFGSIVIPAVAVLVGIGISG